MDEKCGSFKTKLVHGKILRLVETNQFDQCGCFQFRKGGQDLMPTKSFATIYFNICWGDCLADRSKD